MCLKKFLRKHSTDLFCSEACEEAFDELSAQREEEERE
jgi:YHS domain-containing protein